MVINLKRNQKIKKIRKKCEMVPEYIRKRVMKEFLTCVTILLIIAFGMYLVNTLPGNYFVDGVIQEPPPEVTKWYSWFGPLRMVYGIVKWIIDKLHKILKNIKKKFKKKKSQGNHKTERKNKRRKRCKRQGKHTKK